MALEIVIPGQPLGKGRARFSRKSGVAYTPAKTRSAEAVIKQFAAEATGQAPLATAALAMDIEAVFAVPPSWPKYKREAALKGAPHIIAPDADNILKLVCDALNGVVFHDDRIVATVTVRKRYGPSPYTKIRITDAGEPAPGFNIKHIHAVLAEMEAEGKASVDAVFKKI
jgi:Holliday junction resolvase RusA-like endonuclease